MNQLIKKIDELIPEGSKNKHSYFQLQYFVIGKEPTVQARIKACKQELISRKDSIQAILLQIEESNDQLKAHQMRVEQLRVDESFGNDVSFDIRQVKRKIIALQSQIIKYNDSLKSYEEEANFLLGLYDKLIEIEPPKDWDSIEVQAEYWNAKLTRELEYSMLQGNAPGNQLIQSIMCMPDGFPVKNKINGLIEAKKEAIKQLTLNKEKE